MNIQRYWVLITVTMLALAGSAITSWAQPPAAEADAAAGSESDGASQPFIRLGMIGLDTSHVIAFTKYLNDPKNNTGCRVVAGYPGGSPDFPASANRVEGFTARLRTEYGLEIADSIEELCEKVDGILLESVDGRPHLEQARIVIDAGKPLFVDKPVAHNLTDVISLYRLAEKKGVPCWSSSSLRYGENIAGARENDALGQIMSAATCLGPVHGPSFTRIFICLEFMRSSHCLP